MGYYLGKLIVSLTADLATVLGGGALVKLVRSLKAAKGAAVASKAAMATAAADLGTKLEYFFGNATGSAHNLKRTGDMASQLNAIGIRDNIAGRKLFEQHLRAVYANPASVAGVQVNGRVVREGLLSGPNGILKTETIWEGNKLITGNLYGGNTRYRNKPV